MAGPVLRRHTYIVASVSYHPDGTRLASGSGDKTVRQWAVASGEALGPVLRGHTGWVTGVSYHPDGTRLASGRMVR